MPDSPDFKASINAVSDVIANRPTPIRAHDQIYMKAADMYLQARHVAKWFNGLDVAFVGDGDGLALLLVHLKGKGLVPFGPKSVTVFDFDDRVVNSIESFAQRSDYQDQASGRLYNVCQPLPADVIGKFDAFYTNPPFGAKNQGKSVEAFMRRGVELCKCGATACVVVADHMGYDWTHEVLRRTQTAMLRDGFAVAEMIPTFHEYHLDDAPELTSCSIIFRRLNGVAPTMSVSLEPEWTENFYGEGQPLMPVYVKDRTGGGRFSTEDYIYITEQVEPGQNR